ncbi:MAG: hypothetical protein ABIM60_00045 [candidate division WOR-3 bacterium]
MNKIFIILFIGITILNSEETRFERIVNIIKESEILKIKIRFWDNKNFLTLYWIDENGNFYYYYEEIKKENKNYLFF